MRIADDKLDSGNGGNFVRRSLRVTSGDQNLRFGIFAMDATDGSAGVLIGGCGHGAGVENNDLRVVRRAGTLQSAVEQLPLDRGSVGLRSPASEILNVVGRHSLIILSAKLRLSFADEQSGCTITSTSNKNRSQVSNPIQSSWHLTHRKLVEFSRSSP